MAEREPAEAPVSETHAKPVWTVDTWKIKPGRQPHFLRRCGVLSPESLVLFQDLEEQSLFWSPEKWQSRKALDAWRNGGAYRSTLEAVKDDVLEHVTHVMKDLSDFPPRR